MKISQRYSIELNPASEVGICCVYVTVKTKTRSWSNGPIITDADDFSVLTPEVRRAINRLRRKYEDLETLLDACEEGDEQDVAPIDVRLVMANCQTNRRYLYVSDTNEVLSEADIIAYAKECEG